MKKIKFRGLAIQDYTGKPITEKKFVYGNVWANEDNSYVIIGEYKDAKGMSNYYVVDPDSVAQFVGYDADGNEVYEGDICHCEELGDCFIVLLGYSVPGYLPLNSKEIEWHLKEREKNDN